ncbi:MAG TPA: hypothetical protein VF533_15350, partial [Solirubrobacteraceae bacterium]
MHVRSTRPRTYVPAAAALTAALALAAAPGSAQAAASCTFDAAGAKVAVDASGLGTAARLSRTPGGAIQLDGAACGAATVTTTDTIVVTGGSGLQQIVVDLSGGAFAPGKTVETGTGAISEIELAVDGGTGLEFPLGDELRVVGGAAADTFRFTGKDVLLNADSDADVTTTDVEALAAEGGGGADHLLGDGAAPASLPLRLDGGAADDVLAGGDADDVLEGGAGDDVETGNAGRDTFREGTAANGADSLDGGG